MKRIFRYALPGVALVLLAAAGLVGNFMLNFDPSQFKLQMIRAVQEQQQRTLRLDGEIKLTLLPVPGATIENISLSEVKSEKQFAAAAQARLTLALLPLLSGKMVVSEVELKKLKLDVVKFRDGSNNLDDLLGKQGEAVASTGGFITAMPLKFDLSSIKIVKSELSYRDAISGAHYSLKEINLASGRIASGIPVKLSFEAQIQSAQPRLDIAAQLATTLSYDVKNQFIRVADLELLAKGTVLDFSRLTIQAKGDASVNFAMRELFANQMAISVAGTRGKEVLNARLDLPALNFGRDKVTAEHLSFNASMDGEQGKLVTAVTLNDMQSSAQTFKSSSLLMTVELRQPAQVFKLNLSSSLVGSLETRQVNFPNVLLALTASGDRFPGKSLSSELTGSMQLDGGRESVQLNKAGGVLQSRLKLKVALKGFAEPAIRFDVAADQFDADIYFPQNSAVAPVNTAAETKQPFDLSVLEKLNMLGSLRIDTLKLANVKAGKLRMDIKAKKGKISISPLSANLYKGTLTGSIAINAARPIPGFVLKQDFHGIELGRLLKDAADFDMLAGSGNLRLNLGTQGNTVNALKEGLHGAFALDLADGAIRGVNLETLVRGRTTNAQGVKVLKPDAGEKTTFRELNACFQMNRGVAHNDDLQILSDFLHVTGKGDIDIGHDSAKYSAQLAGAANESLRLPVKFIGPYSDISIQADYGAHERAWGRQKSKAGMAEKKKRSRSKCIKSLKQL